MTLTDKQRAILDLALQTNGTLMPTWNHDTTEFVVLLFHENGDRIDEPSIDDFRELALQEAIRPKNKRSDKYIVSRAGRKALEEAK